MTSIKIEKPLGCMIQERIETAFPTVDIVEVFGGQAKVDAVADELIDSKDRKGNAMLVVDGNASYRPIHVEKDLDGYIAVTGIVIRDEFARERSVFPNVTVKTFVIDENVLDNPSMCDSGYRCDKIYPSYYPSKGGAIYNRMEWTFETCRGLCWDAIDGSSNDNRCGGEIFTSQRDDHRCRNLQCWGGPVGKYVNEGEDRFDHQHLFWTQQVEMKSHTRLYYYRAFAHDNLQDKQYPKDEIVALHSVDNGDDPVATSDDWDRMANWVACKAIKFIDACIAKSNDEAPIAISDHKIEQSRDASIKAFQSSMPAVRKIALDTCNDNLMDMLPHLRELFGEDVNYETFDKGWGNHMVSMDDADAVEHGYGIGYNFTCMGDMNNNTITVNVTVTITPKPVPVVVQDWNDKYKNKFGSQFTSSGSRDTAIGSKILSRDYPDPSRTEGPVETGEAIMQECKVSAGDEFCITTREWKHGNFPGLAAMVKQACEMQQKMAMAMAVPE